MRYRHSYEQQNSGGTPGGFGRGGRGQVLGQGGGRGMRLAWMTDGDIRLVMLTLLAEQPRQGQEILAALGQRLGGRCGPGPALIYPNLMLLEDMGLAAAIAATDGRRLFALTEQGAALLQASRAVLDEIQSRLGQTEATPARGGRGNGQPNGVWRRCRRGGFAAASAAP